MSDTSTLWVAVGREVATQFAPLASWSLTHARRMQHCITVDQERSYRVVLSPC